jgi:hypothetical protein
MKAESTIRGQMSQLRSYIDKHKSDMEAPSVRYAHAMETALQWVSTDCDWTPISTVKNEAALFDDLASHTADGGS